MCKAVNMTGEPSFCKCRYPAGTPCKLADGSACEWEYLPGTPDCGCKQWDDKLKKHVPCSTSDDEEADFDWYHLITGKRDQVESDLSLRSAWRKYVTPENIQKAKELYAKLKQNQGESDFDWYHLITGKRDEVESDLSIKGAWRKYVTPENIQKAKELYKKFKQTQEVEADDSMGGKFIDWLAKQKLVENAVGKLIEKYNLVKDDEEADFDWYHLITGKRDQVESDFSLRAAWRKYITPENIQKAKELYKKLKQSQVEADFDWYHLITGKRD
jgi:hypothetical protein